MSGVQRFDLSISLFSDATPQQIAQALEKAARKIAECDSLTELEATKGTMHNRPAPTCIRMDYGLNDLRFDQDGEAS